MFCSPAARATEGVYTVKKGETLGEITARFGLTVNALANYNHLSNPDHLLTGQKLRLPLSAKADTTYVIRRGDTLSEIARHHGLTTQALARYNGLADPDTVRVGQQIRIPSHSSAHLPAPRLPPGLKRRLDRVPVRPGHWKYIVIHHSGTRMASPKGMDAYHRRVRHMENGLAYHFVIGNGHGYPNGKIYVGHRWTAQLQGGHLASEALNRISLGICLIGNFEKEHPTARQMKSLRALVYYLAKRCGIDKAHIEAHEQINPEPTRCPGRYFPMQSFKASLPL